jgi:hypothetical protein
MQKDAKKIVKIVSLSLLFLFVIIFAFINSKDLIFGVKIKNVNITDGEKFTGSLLRITGNAKHAVNLFIDDREISIDQGGNFDETVALLPGYNIISIKAKDKFGHSDEKDYKLIYEDTENTPLQ